jgi:hypothetical protein
MSAEVGLLGLILRPMFGSMFVMDEIDVKRTGDTVRYTILTSSFGKPGSKLAESLLTIKSAIYSLIAPPINNLKIVNMLPMEEGRFTSRYKLILEGKFTDRAVKKFNKRVTRKQKRRR